MLRLVVTTSIIFVSLGCQEPKGTVITVTPKATEKSSVNASPSATAPKIAAENEVAEEDATVLPEAAAKPSLVGSYKGTCASSGTNTWAQSFFIFGSKRLNITAGIYSDALCTVSLGSGVGEYEYFIGDESTQVPGAFEYDMIAITNVTANATGLTFSIFSFDGNDRLLLGVDDGQGNVGSTDATRHRKLADGDTVLTRIK